MHLRFLLGVVAACLALLGPSALGFIVSNSDNDGPGSLRQAILDANAAGGSQAIRFDPDVFTVATPGSIRLFSSLPDVNCDLVLTGPGAKAVSLGGSNGRLIKLTTGKQVQISGLSFVGTSVVGGHGANGVSGGTLPGAGGNVQGGVIFNQADLVITDCYFGYNEVVGGDAGVGVTNAGQDGGVGGNAEGGAIYSEGTLTLRRCTFFQNKAKGGTGGSGSDGPPSGNGGMGGTARGGAVHVNAGTMLAVCCTFVTNECDGGGGGHGGYNHVTSKYNPNGVGGTAEGGGAYSELSLSLNSCTVALNHVAAGSGGFGGVDGAAHGGGIFVTNPSEVGNTIIARNADSSPAFQNNVVYPPADLFGPVNSQDFNLIGASEGSTGFTGVADQTGTAAAPLDPKFDPAGLQDNGGPVSTLRIVRGTPAADRGKNLVDDGFDARGFARTVDLDAAQYPNATGGDGTDIGAFESQSPPDLTPVAIYTAIYATAGTPFNAAKLLAFDGDHDVLTYSLVSGALPDGLTINADGSVTGTASTPGVVVLQFKVNDGIEDSATGGATLYIYEERSLVVNTTSGVSDQFDGFTSLPEAISYAATLLGPQSITFDAAVFATRKTLVLTNVIATFNSYNLIGPAAGVTISGEDKAGLFAVFGGAVGFEKSPLLMARRSRMARSAGVG